VQGLAASMLYEKDDPESPLNRRISIIVMNREAEDRVFKAAESEAAPPPEDDAAPDEAKDLRPHILGR